MSFQGLSLRFGTVIPASRVHACHVVTDSSKFKDTLYDDHTERCESRQAGSKVERGDNFHSTKGQISG
jgi:hypothetical protein